MDTAVDTCIDVINQEMEIQWHIKQSGDIPPDEEGLPCFAEKYTRMSAENILEQSENPRDEEDTAPPGVEDEDQEKLLSLSACFQYKMNHKQRGLFVIFNHKTFSVNAGERIGTNLDRDNLLKTAKHLGFTTFYHDNLTVDEIKQVMESYAGQDHANYDCFACAILTHGGGEDHLYAKDGKYPLRDILGPFQKTGTLIGKPKLFFIQACRGRRYDDGVVKEDQVDAGPGEAEDDAEMRNQTYIPIEADFFIGYSTVEGYYAWRNRQSGSWFINALCSCLQKYAESLELVQIMTEVNRMVAYNYESKAPKYSGKKQMPSIVTRLTGSVYFRRARTELNDETTDELLDKEIKRTKELGPPPCQDITQKKQSDDNEPEVDLLQVELELSKILRKKAEIEMQEQDLKQKIIQCKLKSLKK